MKYPAASLIAVALAALAAPGCDAIFRPTSIPGGAGGFEVMLPKPLVPEGGRLEGFVFGVPVDRPLAVLWMDPAGRICSDLYGKVPSDRIAFEVAVRDPLYPSGMIVATDPLTPEHRATSRFVIEPTRRDWNGFVLAADPGAGTSTGEDWQRFRRLGARFAITGTEDAKLAAYAGLRPLVADVLFDRATLRPPAGQLPPTKARPSCPSDPAEREAVRPILRNRALALKKAGVAGVSLGREPAITRPGGTEEFCLCRGCAASFLTGLRKRYNNCEALSRAWGIGVPSWEAASPPALADLLAKSTGGGMNLAPWCDLRSSTDSSWSGSMRWMRSTLRQFDPDVPVGFMGGREPGARSGYDWQKMLGWADWAVPPADGLTGLIVRDLNSRKIPLLASVGLRGADGRRELWNAVLLGRKGLVVSGKACGDESIWREARRAASGMAHLIGSAKADDSGVGIYWSHRSLQLRTALGMRPSGAARAWVDHLARIGITPRIVIDSDLLRIGRSGLKALILPETLSLSRREATGISDFARSGGLVVAGARCGIFDGDGREGPPAGALYELFGVTRKARVAATAAVTPVVLKDGPGFTDGVNLAGLKAAEGGLKATTSAAHGRSGDGACLLLRDAGKGLACWLNIEMGSGKPATEARLVANVLDMAGIAEQHPVWVGGVRLEGVRRISYDLGSVRIVAVWAPGIRRPVRGVLGLGKTWFVYDATDELFISQTNRPFIELRPDRPAILACFDEQVPPMDLRIFDRGGRIEWRAMRERTAPRADTVYRVEVTAPSGRLVTHYTRTVFARDGRAAGALTPAVNEPVGQWSVKVTDVATGNAVTGTFLKKTARFEKLFPMSSSAPLRRKPGRWGRPQ